MTMRILIVEDDEDSRVYLQRVLESKGHEVEVAEDGLVALNAAYDAPPDIIISDILMPTMDGYLLCRNIKGDESLKDIPFIFYTATYLDPKDRELGLSLGASRYLEKPMEFSELLKVIEDVMEEVASGQLTELDVPKKSEREIDDAYQQILARKLEKKIAELEKQHEVSKQSHEMLRQSEERFRDFAESSSDWLWETDEHLRFTYISMGHRSSSGFDPNIFIGKKKEETAAENTNDEKWLQHFDDLENRRPFHDFTFELTIPDGSRAVVRVNGKPVFDHDDVFRGYRGTSSDITERKALEEQLRQSQKMEALGTLASGIAHNFNNFLVPILSLSRQLLKSEWRNREEREDLHVIIDASERANSLVKEIMAFGRLNAKEQSRVDISKVFNGALQLKEISEHSRLNVKERRRVDISKALDDILRLIRSTLPKTINLTVSSDQKCGFIIADVVDISNVLMNVLSNAISAIGDAQGDIGIYLSREEINTATGQSQSDLKAGNYVKIVVQDTGCGMDNACLGHIFEPFFTTKAEGEGSGLGLSTAYGIVNNYGGTIRASSQLGQGTMFEIFLPLTE